MNFVVEGRRGGRGGGGVRFEIQSERVVLLVNPVLFMETCCSLCEARRRALGAAMHVQLVLHGLLVLDHLRWCRWGSQARVAGNARASCFSCLVLLLVNSMVRGPTLVGGQTQQAVERTGQRKERSQKSCRYDFRILT